MIAEFDYLLSSEASPVYASVGALLLDEDNKLYLRELRRPNENPLLSYTLHKRHATICSNKMYEQTIMNEITNLKPSSHYWTFAPNPSSFMISLPISQGKSELTTFFVGKLSGARLRDSCLKRYSISDVEQKLHCEEWQFDLGFRIALKALDGYF